MIPLLSLFALLEAQPLPTHFVRLHQRPISELHPALLYRLVAVGIRAHSFFGSRRCPLVVAPNHRQKTFRRRPKLRANEPLAAASFNPGM